MANLDLELVRHALQTAREHGFSEVQIEVANDRFSAILRPLKPPPKATAPEAKSEASADPVTEIRAGLVGYYREAKTPLTVGLHVEKGSVVAVVAALGIANDVEAPMTGEVTEVLVSQNQPVMYGQVLARIKP